MTIRDIAVSFGVNPDKKSFSSAEKTVNGLKNFAMKALGAIGVAVSISGLKNFADQCVQAGSDVQEMENKFNVVFSGISDEVDAWAENFANSIGRSKNAIKTYLADQQNLLVGFGYTREEGAALAEQMTSLALDIASFANTDEAAAVNYMTKAVMGETEAARQLGAVLSDTTRAEAMFQLGLTGSYEKLDQQTKMMVNYQAIVNQSKDAIGDCARSIDSYASQQKILQAAQEEFKQYIGTQLIPVYTALTKIMSKGTKAAQAFAKKILETSDGQSRITIIFEKMQAQVQRLKPAIDRMTETMRNGFDKARNFINLAAEKLGGIDNLFKILGITAAAFFLVMKWSSITKAASTFLKVLKTVMGVFNLGTLKIALIVAAVAALLLILEDFYNFMIGNDSVIGTIFDNMGIGADNARQKIFDAFGKIKDFLLGVWDTIKEGAKMFIDTVVQWFQDHSSSIRENFEQAWGLISQYLQGVWTFLTQLASTLFGDTEDSIDGSTQSTKEKLLSVWQNILETLTAVWDALYEAADAVFDALCTVVQVVFDWIKAFWDKWGADILAHFKVIWDNIGKVFNAFLEVVKGVANFIKSVFTGDWKGAWEAIKQIFKGVWDAIVAILDTAWSGIKLAFKMALDFIKNLWNKVWNGIKNFFAGILDWIEQKTGLNMDGVRAVFSNGLNIIKTTFSTVFENIKTIISTVWNVIKTIVQGAINAVKAVIQTVLAVIKGDWQGAWDGIKNYFSTIWNTIKSVCSTIFNGIKTVIQNTLNGISSIISSIWNTIKATFTAALDNIKTVVSNVWNGIKSVTSSVWNGISSAVTGVWNSITSGVTGAVNTVKNLVSGAWNSIKSTTTSIWNGIKSAITSPVESAKSLVTSAVEKLKSAFNFKWSLPKLSLPHISVSGGVAPYGIAGKGSLPKFSISWYKHGGILTRPTIFGAMGNKLLGGGEAGKEAVLPLSQLWSKMKEVVSGVVVKSGNYGEMAGAVNGVLAGISRFSNEISALSAAGTASAKTASHSTYNSTSSSMTQNVNISNSYSGGSVETQRNVSKAMNKSAEDATTYLARGLAFARG